MDIKSLKKLAKTGGKEMEETLEELSFQLIVSGYISDDEEIENVIESIESAGDFDELGDYENKISYILFKMDMLQKLLQLKKVQANKEDLSTIADAFDTIKDQLEELSEE